MNRRRTTRTTAVLIVLLLALATAQFAPPAYGSGPGAVEPGQIVVKLKPLGNIQVLNTLYGLTTILPILGRSDTFLLQAPPGVNIQPLIVLLNGDPRVEYAEPNYTQEAPDAHTDRTYAWGGDDNVGGENHFAALRLSEAHAISEGYNTVIAVLDTGVQRTHPDLARYLDSTQYDFVDNDLIPEDAPNGLDDDGDGVVDEAVGHGTHVAGIAHKVAPRASIMPLRVLNSDGRGNNFRTANAMLFAAYNGADVINLSLGTASASRLINDVVQEIAARGVVVVAAAGNLNSTAQQFPAAESCAIAVASVSSSGQKSPFSNYGTWIDVAAPGEGVLSPVPTDRYARWSGTSMSTPFVAGQVALLRSLNDQLTLNQLGRLIGGTAQPLSQTNPEYANQLGKGRIDVLSSLQALTQDQWPDQVHDLYTTCQ